MTRFLVVREYGDGSTPFLVAVEATEADALKLAEAKAVDTVQDGVHPDQAVYQVLEVRIVATVHARISAVVERPEQVPPAPAPAPAPSKVGDEWTSPDGTRWVVRETAKAETGKLSWWLARPDLGGNPYDLPNDRSRGWVFFDRNRASAATFPLVLQAVD